MKTTIGLGRESRDERRETDGTRVESQEPRARGEGTTHFGLFSSRLTHRSCHSYLLLSLVPCLLTLTACSQDSSTRPTSNAPVPPSIDGSQFLLTSEPEESKDVIYVRENANDGDDIVIVGRIGGSENPWIDGRAAFSIVDGSLQACSDIPGDLCEKPWDYCCETPKLPAATALVKVVDEVGEVVKADAKGLLNVEELSTVVIKGKAKRDDAGNLTVLASGVYVKKE